MTMQQLCKLSEQELDEIARRVDSASNGPWFSYVVGRDCEAWSNCIEIGCCNELGSFAAIELSGGTTADQDFIAAARQDLPKLLDEVRALRARLRALEAADTHGELEGGVFLSHSPALQATGGAGVSP